MKHELMQHQQECTKKSERRRGFGLFCEQGTGKSVILLAEAERYFERNIINGMLVVAPNGVHTNWVKREIPKHLSCRHSAVAYRSGQKAAINKVEAWSKDRTHELRILTINIEAVNTEKGFALCKEFLTTHSAMLVMDESDRMKNPNTGITKRMLALAPYATVRRAATGTPVNNNPADVFTQFKFLSPGTELLGTNSYRAFVAEYAELLHEKHPLVEHIIKKQKNKRVPAPQIVAKNPDGTPRWRNLDRLAELIEPHSFRVTKAECLDLPEKIYKTHFFQLNNTQRAAYDQMEQSFYLMMEDEIITATKLTALLKLQQITSGFVLHEGDALYIEDKQPRMTALQEVIKDVRGQFIVWARFKEELFAASALCSAMDIPYVRYDGSVSRKARDKAVDGFQSGEARAFIGQPQAGGVGLTLTAAETVVYVSNDFSMRTRNQSEDRAHRIGTKNPVVYIDIVAEDTIDERIAQALQDKTNLAAAILDQPRTNAKKQR